MVVVSVMAGSTFVQGFIGKPPKIEKKGWDKKWMHTQTALSFIDCVGLGGQTDSGTISLVVIDYEQLSILVFLHSKYAVKDIDSPIAKKTNSKGGGSIENISGWTGSHILYIWKLPGCLPVGNGIGSYWLTRLHELANKDSSFSLHTIK